ncbi:ribonuclease Y [bacterium]|nr:ribonuclease Y [bacterium]
MSISWILLLASLGSLSFGSILGYFARLTIAKKQADSIETKLAKTSREAKEKAQDIILKAKEKAVQAIEQVKSEEQAQRQEIVSAQKRLVLREERLEKQFSETETKQVELGLKIEKVKNIKKEIESLREKEADKLEKIAKLSREKAKDLLLKQVEKESQETLLLRIKKLEKNANDELSLKAREIITLAMQKFTSEQISAITTSSLTLPSDDLKGRIIGKEGRNIKALENLTGVEILVDDTPGAVTISGFNPVRRHLAKFALEKLISDGRIHPARIEEAVEQAKSEMIEKMKQAGESVLYELGITGLDPKLTQLLGRLMFRTSFGQNVLVHSLEVAHLAGSLASELGADVALCKKAGLLHDIGKAVDREIEGTHVEIGKKILTKFNISEKVIQAMQSHHEEYDFEILESIIIQVADSISSSRPGARKDTLENYLKRLEDLEKVAVSFDTVEKAYAIQAGREIRVFVRPEEITDLESINLAKQIASRVEKELEYPGEIKVNVIRETRAIEYAR